jgi:hypothetical protein
MMMDYAVILARFLKLCAMRPFHKRKENPDLYKSDEFDQFHNQASAHAIPLKNLWDILVISRIIERLLCGRLRSVYVRGGLPFGNFFKGKSDLDLIVFIKGNTSGLEDLNRFLTLNYSKISNKYTKLDLKMTVEEEIESNPKFMVIMKTQAAYVTGEKLNISDTIPTSCPALWNFFEPMKNIKPEIVPDLVSKDRQKALGLLKNLSRAIYEKVAIKRKQTYTKSLLHINDMVQKGIVEDDKQAKFLIQKMISVYNTGECGDEELNDLILSSLAYLNKERQ